MEMRKSDPKIQHGVETCSFGTFMKTVSSRGATPSFLSPPQPRIKEQTKLTPENMAFSGCPVASGRCTGVVVATGMATPTI